MRKISQRPAVYLDILALVPTVYKQCSSCEMVLGQSGIGEKARQEHLQEYPAEMLDEYVRLSDWIRELAQRYGKAIQIRVIDPQSGLGLWKSLRHGVRHYPTFIINHKQTYAGWDKDKLEELLQNALKEMR